MDFSQLTTTVPSRNYRTTTQRLPRRSLQFEIALLSLVKRTMPVRIQVARPPRTIRGTNLFFFSHIAHWAHGEPATRTGNIPYCAICRIKLSPSYASCSAKALLATGSVVITSRQTCCQVHISNFLPLSLLTRRLPASAVHVLRIQGSKQPYELLKIAHCCRKKSQLPRYRMCRLDI